MSAVIGSGVSKAGMAEPSSWVRWNIPASGPGEEWWRGDETGGAASAPSRCSCARSGAAAGGRMGALPAPGSNAAETARTSQALTETPCRAAASSTRTLRCSGRRRVTRAVPPSSPYGCAAGGVASAAVGGAVSVTASASSGDGSECGGVTTNAGSPPRSRTSTEPGARSRVISSAAADNASSRVSLVADSRALVRRSASSRASGPPASAATVS